jgi:hypothetical protein
MRKADVEFHSDGYGRATHPAVNVKCYKGIESVTLPFSEGSSGHIGGPMTEHFSDPAFTHDWVRENVTADDLDACWQFACERGWEMLQDDAREIFGAHVKVYSEGRSSGWAVVEGLPEFAGWDAVMLGKWAKFSKWAKAQADDIMYQVVTGIYYNEFEPAREESEREADPTLQGVMAL